MRKLRFRAVLVSIVVISVFLVGINTAVARDSDFIEAFREALYAGDNDRMSGLIDDNLDSVPGEVDGFIPAVKDKAIDDAERETRFFLLEMITTQYKDKTRDAEPLKAFKRAYFESRLSAPIRSKKRGGVHHVEFAMQVGEVRDKFAPDNIIIDAGDTVRWTNNNKIAHLFATSMFIGEKGIFTPSIKPGKTWEYTFTKPGNYYLICFVHVGMIAKVKVLGAEEPEEEVILEEDEEIGEDTTPISDGIPMEPVGSQSSVGTDDDEVMPKEDIKVESEAGAVEPSDELKIDSEPLKGSQEPLTDTDNDDLRYDFTDDDDEFMDEGDGFLDDDLDDEELFFDDLDEDEEFLED